MKTKRLALSILLAAIIVGMGWRWWRLGSVPASLYWDEAAMLADARFVATTGFDMHQRVWYQVMYPSYGDYKLPVYIWLSSLTVFVFGESNWAVRLPSAVAGTAALGLIWLITSELWLQRASKARDSLGTDFKMLFQASTVFVMASSPWATLFSRTAFEGHLGQVLVAASFWLVLRSRRRWPWLVLAALVGGLATYAYFSVRFVWPVVFGLGFWLTSPQKPLLSRPKKQFFHAVLAIGVFAVTLVPMMKSPLYQDSTRFRLSTTSIFSTQDWPVVSNQLRELAGNTTISRVFFHRKVLPLQELAQNYSDHMSLSYLFLSGDPNLRHGTGAHGLFLLWFLPGFIVGWWGLSQRWPKLGTALFLWWLVALLPAAIPETTPHALRSLNALVPLTIVIGWGTAEIFNWLQQRRNVAGLGLLFLLLMFNLLHFSHFYFVEYPQLSQPDWQAGYREIVAVVAEYQDQVDQVWVSRVDDRWYIWYLAFGPISETEIQKLPSTGFQFSAYQNIHWTPLEWSRVNSTSSWLIIEPHEALEEHLQQLSVPISERFTVVWPYEAVIIKP